MYFAKTDVSLEEGNNRRQENRYNENLRNLYSSPNIIRMMRWAPYVMIHAYGMLVGKPEGKNSSMIQRLIWDYPFKANVRDMAYDCGMNSEILLGWPARHPVTIPNTITWPIEVE
jgi:hypothetical protein